MYGRYVEEGLLRDLDNPLARLEGQTILGTEPFLDHIRRTYVLTRTADRREQPAFERARQSVPLYVLAEWVGQVYGCGPERLFALAGSDRRARRLLMYGACRCCWGGQSLTSLAKRFGVSLSGLTMARNRVEQALARDEAMRLAWQQIQQRLRAWYGL